MMNIESVVFWLTNPMIQWFVRVNGQGFHPKNVTIEKVSGLTDDTRSI